MELLIELVQGNACLYDKKEPRYKDVKFKEKIWEEIGKQLNLPVKDCKVKWKNLRDRYRKEKMNEDSPSGSSQKLGTPWKFMRNLEFLRDAMEPASTTGNLELEIEDSVEWLEYESSYLSPRPVCRKRKQDNIIIEVFAAMKKKYEASPCESSTDRYGRFMSLLREKFDRLPENEVDDVEIEILQMVNRRINANNK